MHQVYVESVICTLVAGAALMALFYHGLLFFFNKDRLLLHYLLYLSFTVWYAFIRSGLDDSLLGVAVTGFMHRHFNEAIQMIFLLLYFNFVVRSVQGAKGLKRLQWIWRVIAFTLTSYTLFFTVNQFLALTDIMMDGKAIRIFIFLSSAILLFHYFKETNSGFHLYILSGCSAFFLCGIASFLTMIWARENDFIYPVEWLMLGSLCDILFFSLALADRNNTILRDYGRALLHEATLKIKLQEALIEKQSLLRQERERIAADMHDDIGSGLTKIAYLSQVAPNGGISRIAEIARELVEDINLIVWALVHENDSLEALISYIRRYSVDYFESQSIPAQVDVTGRIPEMTVGGTFRSSKRPAAARIHLWNNPYIYHSARTLSAKP